LNVKQIDKPLQMEIDGVVQNETAIDCLTRNCPQISRQQLKRAMQFGAVWLARDTQVNRIRRSKKTLQTGDILHLYYNPSILNTPVQAATLVADEGSYSVWDKPGGMFSQGTRWGDHSSIARWVELNDTANRPAFLVHRLDRATRGLIIIAHTKKMAARLAHLFEKREIEKHYRAWVAGHFCLKSSPEKIDLPLDGKNALTYILSSQFDQASKRSLLRIKIETGRKHQIRQHLAALGFPVIGERLYAPEAAEASDKMLPDLQLVACYMAFTSPLDGARKVYELTD